MSVATDEILEKLKSLSLIEASELVKQIEEAFGVTAAAPSGGMMMMSPAAGGAAPAAASTPPPHRGRPLGHPAGGSQQSSLGGAPPQLDEHTSGGS